jgi:tetratricopeptide (TPR) repeat protein
VQALEAMGPGDRVANALVSYVAYAWKTLWPSRLAAFYPLATGLPVWEVAAAAIAVIGLTAGAVLALRQAPWAAMGWLWFAGTLVPVIGLVQVGAQGMADRYAYVPIIGLLVAAVWGADVLRQRLAARVPAAAVAGITFAVLAVLSALTVRQISTWRDQETLFGHALEVSGDDVRIRGLLAQGLRSEGKPDQALPHAEAAVRLAPWSGRAWLNLGLVLRDLGRPGEAHEALSRAVELAPDLPLAWTFLGQTAAELGRADEAERALRRATALAPDDAHSWNELGLLLAASRRDDEARAAYRSAVAANPRSAPAWTNLAILAQRTGRVDEAEEAFTAAARAEPANPVFWRNLGVFEAMAGRPVAAARALREALARGPATVDLLRRLAAAELDAGDRGAAIATAARLDALAPGAGDAIRARAGAGP